GFSGVLGSGCETAEKPIKQGVFACFGGLSESAQTRFQDCRLSPLGHPSKLFASNDLENTHFLWLWAVHPIECRSVVFEEQFLPLVEDVRIQAQLVTRIGDRRLFDQMPLQDGNLLLCSGVPSSLYANSKPRIFQFRLRQCTTRRRLNSYGSLHCSLTKGLSESAVYRRNQLT
ncbi:hypothetical protein LCGC14_2724030, partial [marine sediment metagenome]